MFIACIIRLSSNVIYFTVLTLHFLVIVVKYAKYQEVPEDEFSGWLSLLFEEHGLERLTTEQTEDIRQQFCVCLVSSARNFEFLSFRA